MMPKRKVVKKKSAGKKAVEKKAVQSPRGHSKYSETDIRHALFVAATYTNAEGELGFTAASRKVNIPKQTIAGWAEKFPDLLLDVMADAEKFKSEKRAILKEKFMEIALLATNEHLRRLKDNPDQYKAFELTGVMDYATKNHELLSGRPTGNLGGEMNLVFTYGTANMSDNKPIPNNRIKGNQN